MKKILSIILATLMLFTLAIPAAAYTVSGNTTPYVRRWLDAINDYTVVDYYSYSQAESAYVKTGVLNVKNNSVYYKTGDTVLTTALLYEDEVGFSQSGEIYFITTRSELVKYSASSGVIISLNATELAFDDNNFVIGYYEGTNYFSINGNNGNNNNNNNNNGNNGNNGNNNNAKYPYLTVEDQRMTYVESSDQHHQLYIEQDYLCFNNLILFKNGIKSYGFAKNKVVYITSSNKLVTYEFGAKKQYVKATKVTSLTYDNDGFIVGYTKSNGKTYSL